MRATSAKLLSGSLALLLGACGGASSADDTTPNADRASLCPDEGELRLGRICWNPVGSRWRITADVPSGTTSFDVELLAAGRLRASDHPAATPALDEWYVDGESLRFFLQDRFVEYRAEPTNGTLILGIAENVAGERWEWRGNRAGTVTCRPTDAALESGCLALAGTSWQLGERVVQFEADGRVQPDRGEGREGDRWTQEGSSLRFTFEGQEHSATLTSADAIEGTKGSDSFRATRIPLYPPPIR